MPQQHPATMTTDAIDLEIRTIEIRKPRPWDAPQPAGELERAAARLAVLRAELESREQQPAAGDKG